MIVGGGLSLVLLFLFVLAINEFRENSDHLSVKSGKDRILDKLGDSCEKGKEYNCFAIGMQFRRAGANSSAEQYLLRSCELGLKDSCHNLIILRYEMNSNVKETLNALGKLCVEGYKRGCETKKLFEETNANIQAFQDDCSKNDLSACTKLGDYYRQWAQHVKAFATLKNACDSGSIQACNDWKGNIISENFFFNSKKLEFSKQIFKASKFSTKSITGLSSSESRNGIHLIVKGYFIELFLKDKGKFDDISNKIRSLTPKEPSDLKINVADFERVLVVESSSRRLLSMTLNANKVSSMFFCDSQLCVVVSDSYCKRLFRIQTANSPDYLEELQSSEGNILNKELISIVSDTLNESEFIDYFKPKATSLVEYLEKKDNEPYKGGVDYLEEMKWLCQHI